MKKRQISLFFRSMFLSTVIIFCIIFGSLSVAKIYENIRYVAYGEYKSAVEFTDDGIRILDFYIG